VVIRRTGGLGSDVRFSLNGLTGDAIPMFVDGVPLWMSGYPRNIGNIPINSVAHVEIYRGVVPLRLSADALGGAVNFATDQTYENGGSLSYHVGSYGLLRMYGSAQARHDKSGFVARLSGFVDRARNDYPIDVEVPDAQGRLHPATVRRFHDFYSAYSLRAEVGFLDRPWAERLLLKAFTASSYKEVQHNTVMTVPYGEVDYGLTNIGAILNYDVDLSDTMTLESLVSYSHMATDFHDMSPWVYDWYGDQVRERRVPGEVEADPTDQTWWEDGIFGRVLAEWKLGREQVLIASTSPLFYWVSGDERLQFDPDARDPLSARRFLVRWVSGVGHEWNFLRTTSAKRNGSYRRNTDYRFQNTFNIKNYAYFTSSEEPLPGGVFRDRQRDVISFGVSDGLRYSFTKWLLAKASYEYATRLPNPYETFGDGVLVVGNLELEPEVSHNVNIGPVLDWKKTKTGDWIGTLSGVLRETDNMIVLLGSDRFFSYQNVYSARTLGLEGGLTWTSPLQLLSLDGSGTYTDQRNTSTEGTFQDFEGDRIPNRPWLQASWAARLRFEHLLIGKDTLEPFYQGRYTHEFYRGWESQGIPQYKQKVDSQTAHDAGITYTLKRPNFRLASTFEVQNFTDEKLYDDFGVQRPGRSFHFKLTGDLF
jgi:vitamin B12 transporter